MAGDYVEPPEWRGQRVAARALANMIAREMPPEAIERVRQLLRAWDFVEDEFAVFREVIQRFENTADGFHWSKENVEWLRNLVNGALAPVAKPKKCDAVEVGLHCRLDADHLDKGEPHVY